MSKDLNNNTLIAKNTAFLYARMFFVLLVSLYTTRVVLNVLGVVDYGVYNVVAGFVSMFSFLNTSMSHGVQRFYSYYLKSEEVSLNEVFNTSILIQSLMAVVLFALLESVGVWYLRHHIVLPPDRLYAAQWVFQFSSLSLLITLFVVPYSATIIANEKFDYYAIVSIIDVLLKLLIVIILPYVSFDKLVFYGIFSLLISIVNFFMYFVYARIKFVYTKLRVMFNKVLFKEMISFSGWNVFDSFASMIKGQGVNLLLNVFFGPIVNAARGVAGSVMSAIQGFSINVVSAFRPQLIQSYALHNFHRTQMLLFSMSKICYLLLFFLSVPVIIELDFLLSLWLNDIVPEHTILFTRLTLANLVLGSLHTPLTQTIHATGNIRFFVVVRCIIVTAILPISWLLFKLGFDPSAVFWVSLFATFISIPFGLIILHKEFPFSYEEYFKRVIMPCLIITIIIPIIPILIRYSMNYGWTRFLLVCFASVIGLGISMLISLSKAEKKYLKEMLNKILHRGE